MKYVCVNRKTCKCFEDNIASTQLMSCPHKGRASCCCCMYLTNDVEGMTYFQQSLKKTDGLLPVMSSMVVLTRSPPPESQWKCWHCLWLEWKKRVETCLTKHPAQSQALTNGKKIPTDSGRGVVIKEVEDVNSSLNKTNLDETHTCGSQYDLFSKLWIWFFFVAVETYLAYEQQFHEEGQCTDH